MTAPAPWAALWLACGIAGCTPVGAVATTTGSIGGIAASSERGFQRSLEDNRIWLEVSRRLLVESELLYRRVNVQVHEGRVLLTGLVERAAMREDARRAAGDVAGVRRILNEIAVETPTDFNDNLRDAWIVRRLDVKLMFDAEVRAINYSIEAAGGTVYLIGVAASAAELQRVIDHARDIPYVRRVVSHVRLKGGPAP